jgi:uncharacterized protein YegL
MLDNLSAIEFADNPEPRCPVILLLDRSGSMNGEPISQVNQGLIEFANDLKNDSLASLRVEVAIITFGGTVKVYDLAGGIEELSPDQADASQVFVSAVHFTPPVLTATGGTPMGEAVDLGLRLLNERKAIYKQNGIDYFRPWMFLITDGSPTDFTRWPQAAEAVKLEESRKGVGFFGVGTDGANLEILSKFSKINPPMRLKGLAFKELFVWLSKSLSSISKSRPGEQVSLPAASWGFVDTSIS